MPDLVVLTGQPPGLAEPTALAAAALPDHAGLVEDWLADLDRRVATGQRAAQTRSGYGRAIRPWLRFLAAVARTDRPDPTTVECFLADLVGRKRAPASINHTLAAMSALYRFAERVGRYPHIARAAERLREPRDGPLPCLGHDQIGVLRVAASAVVLAAETAIAQSPPGEQDRCARRLHVALRDRALLGVLYGTGVRLISLYRATVGDWQPQRGELLHRPKGHLATAMIAYVGEQTAAELAAYLAARGELEPTDPLFASHARGSNGQRLSIRSMSQAVLGCLERGGFVQRNEAGHVIEPRRLSAHSIRRSAAQRIVETYDLELARQLLGHASLETTRRAYARVKRAEELRQAATELDGL